LSNGLICHMGTLQKDGRSINKNKNRPKIGATKKKRQTNGFKLKKGNQKSVHKKTEQEKKAPYGKKKKSRKKNNLPSTYSPGSRSNGKPPGEQLGKGKRWSALGGAGEKTGGPHWEKGQKKNVPGPGENQRPAQGGGGKEKEDGPRLAFPRPRGPSGGFCVGGPVGGRGATAQGVSAEKKKLKRTPRLKLQSEKTKRKFQETQISQAGETRTGKCGGNGGGQLLKGCKKGGHWDGKKRVPL